MQPVAVLGATGGQGGAVADALLAARFPVRAVVRSPRSDRAVRLSEKGAEVVAGDLADVSSLTAAFTGAQAAFAVTTPFEEGVDVEVGQGRNIIDAAGQARLPHLVFSSVAGADRITGVPHFDSKHTVEQELGRAGLNWTVVAPTYFFDNLFGSIAELQQGTLSLPLSSKKKLQQTARDDLGAFVAEVVKNPERHLHQRIELASDELDLEQMAKVLSEALRFDIRPNPEPVGPEVPADSDMGAMWRFLEGHGYQVDIRALHDSCPDVPWTSFAAWVEAQFTPGPHA
ncbi:NmrA/HSCARG family protein [Streptomyces sp. NPDC015171]|uniref:NmrA/HSCARG family protein n=1 Tax=Streptomyces sp. NPDC015171 TaxID=3364945 RepID=UPI0036FAD1A3